MKRDFKLFLRDILASIAAIKEFIRGMNYELFLNDDKTTSAVIRKLEIIGEAIKHLPEKLKNQYPYIEWRDIAGMRDRLIHVYFGVDYKLVWETITVNLLDLHIEISKILEEIES